MKPVFFTLPDGEWFAILSRCSPLGGSWSKGRLKGLRWLNLEKKRLKYGLDVVSQNTSIGSKTVKGLSVFTVDRKRNNRLKLLYRRLRLEDEVDGHEGILNTRMTCCAVSKLFINICTNFFLKGIGRVSPG